MTIKWQTQTSMTPSPNNYALCDRKTQGYLQDSLGKAGSLTVSLSEEQNIERGVQFSKTPQSRAMVKAREGKQVTHFAKRLPQN